MSVYILYGTSQAVYLNMLDESLVPPKSVPEL